jgi:hypothetical protein
MVIPKMKESWVDRNHYRKTTDDGGRSYLYESDGLHSKCVEVADHHRDGTTKAYEHDSSIIGQLLHSGKGKEK